MTADEIWSVAGLSPLSTQQMAENEQGGPDAVTERVLQTKPKHRYGITF